MDDFDLPYKEIYDSLENEADKKLYSFMENVFANHLERPQMTHRDAIREEIGPISERMMEHLVQSVYLLLGQHATKNLEEREYEPVAATAFAVFEIFREGIRIGRKYGIEEGMKMPRLEDA